ncbi:MAG TPA: hemerythrin domain-containing protein [Gallionella sp.]|nr:hemerythrin domain-containing protein [Gallionella sp.]
MISLGSGGAAAPSFDHPLEMLHACHGKIQQQLNTLQKIATHLPVHGCDQQVQQAAQGILRYFDTAGQFHHQDEEENLFPTLLALNVPEKAQVEALIERLLAQHAIMFAAWSEVRAVLVELAEGINTPLPETLIEKLVGSYTPHIELEEAELLTLSARLLSPQQIMTLGRSMAERRGAKFPPLPAA